ncbi:TonB-dependent siderophore receptor [Azospirillum sp. ST 5-10]|uniref:TonB-dependent siderophore receptor n=1 Tax=unclassified Azospirillum TaxID=2630922 RepID=UPI003F49D182
MAGVSPCVVTAVTPAAAQQVQAGDARHTFDIRTRSLADGIAAIGLKTGWRIAYTAELPVLDGERVVQGTMTVTEALDRLLQGTGITYRLTEENAAVLVAPSAAGITVLDPVRVEETAPAGALLPAYAGGQVARGGQVGLLGNIDAMDAPVSITSYTRERIEDQQAQTVADVIRNDPSVRAQSSGNGMLDSYSIRGFAMNNGNSGEMAFNGVYGVAPNYRALAGFAERIEVLKGPTALLNGMAPNSGVGGVINIVPKRAGAEDVTRVTADYGPGEQAGGSADVGRRFGENGAFGVRLNAGYHDGDTALDHQTRTAGFGAAALDYAGDRLRASLDLVYQREDMNAPTRELLIRAGVPVPGAPDGRHNITQPWEWSEATDRSVLFRAEYDLTDAVTLFGDVGGGTTEVDRLFGYPQIQNTAGDTQDSVSAMRFKTSRLTADTGVRGTFDTAGVGHRVTLQATHYEDTFRRGAVYSTVPIRSNLYTPVIVAPTAVAEPASRPKISETELRGVALADTLSFWNDRVDLTLGVRYQTIESTNFGADGAVTSTYDDDAVTPMVGVVVKPWDRVSLYANYIEGLSKGDIAPTTAVNAGEAMAPYVAKQVEAGIKLDFGTFGATFGAFQITKPSGQLAGGVYTSDGEQRNRGLELTVFGEVTPGVRLLGGVMLLDADLTETGSAATRGNTPVGVAEVQANLTAEWDTPFAPGLTLVGTVTHTGRQYVDTANTQSIPAWTTLDIGARYRTEIARTPVTVRATVQNVLGEDYWASVNSWGMITLGAPRTALLSVSAEF